MSRARITEQNRAALTDEKVFHSLLVKRLRDLLRLQRLKFLTGIHEPRLNRDTPAGSLRTRRGIRSWC